MCIWHRTSFAVIDVTYRGHQGQFIAEEYLCFVDNSRIRKTLKGDYIFVISRCPFACPSVLPLEIRLPLN